jgi:hypothetical protein
LYYPSYYCVYMVHSIICFVPWNSVFFKWLL